MAASTGFDVKRLRRWLSLFFVALALPSGILIQQAYSQLRWQTFHQHRLIAEALAGRIDSNLSRLIDQEEARSFGDYQFFAAVPETDRNFPQRSPLSNFPVPTSFPGAIGYFQVDRHGRLTTPLLPPSAHPSSPGFSAEELQKRLVLQNDIRAILSQNRLVGNGKSDRMRLPDAPVRDTPRVPSGRAELEKAVSEPSLETSTEEARGAASKDSVPAQAAFDRLNSLTRQNEALEKTRKQGRITDFDLDYSYQSGLAKKRLRSRNALPVKNGSPRPSPCQRPGGRICVRTRTRRMNRAS